MGTTLADTHWQTILERIQGGNCTPFLGAGVNSGVLDPGSELARKLAERCQYPLPDCTDLARVTQFMAVTKKDAVSPKEEVLRLLRGQIGQWRQKVELADFFKAPDEPLGVLADLPLPVYITTNYDGLMVEALKSRKKDPRRELCRWNRSTMKRVSVFDSACGFEPTPASPIVFHLHGLDEMAESLVLTEDDYVDFLVSISRQQDLLPPRIQEALADASLVFIGYRLADWDFRVLFRALVESVVPSSRRIKVAVQLPLEDVKQREYLAAYFGNANIELYWGTAREFAAELRHRWNEFNR